MKTILVCSQKGGTGKTVISDELVYSFDRTETPCRYYQLDTQGGSQHEERPENDSEDAEVTVVDTPGYILDELPNMLEAADVIVLPCRASAEDEVPFYRMLDLIRTYAKEKPVIIVQNFWNRYSMSRLFRESIEKELHTNEKIVTLRQSEAMTQSHIQQSSVVDYAPGTPIADNTLEVVNTIRQACGQEGEHYDKAARKK